MVFNFNRKFNFEAGLGAPGRAAYRFGAGASGGPKMFRGRSEPRRGPAQSPATPKRFWGLQSIKVSISPKKVLWLHDPPPCDIHVRSLMVAMYVCICRPNRGFSSILLPLNLESTYMYNGPKFNRWRRCRLLRFDYELSQLHYASAYSRLYSGREHIPPLRIFRCKEKPLKLCFSD